jgi:hypothetical protein
MIGLWMYSHSAMIQRRERVRAGQFSNDAKIEGLVANEKEGVSDFATYPIRALQ